MDDTKNVPQSMPEDIASAMTQKQTPVANTKHKDSLFRIIFRDKKELLNLCNALANTDYQNPEDLTITTLEDVLYIKLKNDVSFLLGDHLNLYEHQSTFNPNMRFGDFCIWRNYINPLPLLKRFILQGC